jgi:hypothetical protein
MFTITDARIEALLEQIADETFDFQRLYSAIRDDQPELFDYLNTQDVSFFTTEERAYYEFVVQFLWFICEEEGHQVTPIKSEQLADREDQVWGMKDEKSTMEQILAALKIDISLAELILDLMDEETSGALSDIGREWIFAKTATIASLIFASED